MLQPIGDLPAAVYWRRRAVLLATMVTVVAVVGWLLTAAASGSDGGQPAAAAAAATESDPSGSASSASVDPSLEPIPTPPGGWLTPSSAPTATAAAGASGATGAAPTTNPPAATSAPPPATSAAPPATSAPPPPPPTAPADPPACGDDVTGVTVAPAAPEYAVGSMPTLIISVTNTGAAPCKRDLDAAKQEILIFDGTNRLWGSNDCYPAKSDDVRVLQPGQPVTFEILWSGLSSEPTCTQPRTRLQAGTYTLRARLDQIISPDATITMR